MSSWKQVYQEPDRACCICCIKLHEEMGEFVKQSMDDNLPAVDQLFMKEK